MMMLRSLELLTAFLVSMSLSMSMSMMRVSASASSLVVSESRNRLPMSLSTVIGDLEAEGMSEVSTACVIPSRTVTAAEKQSLFQTLVGGDTPITSKAVGMSNGLALCLCLCLDGKNGNGNGIRSQSQSLSLEEVVQSAVACQGTVVFVPSTTDLLQGEGLWELLAPAMERWLAARDHGDTHGKGCLVVVCDEQVGTKRTRTLLEASAAPILETFWEKYNLQSLEDVFGSVHYVMADQVVNTLVAAVQTTPDRVMTQVKKVVEGAFFAAAPSSSSSPFWERKIATTPLEWAAARTLTGAQRRAVANAMAVINSATAANTVLVSDFGALCDATLKSAQQQFLDSADDYSPKLLGTAVGKQLASNVGAQLSSEWMDLFEKQLVLLQEASFATFRQNLGKLRLGATLGHDMESMVAETVKTFGKMVLRLIPSTMGGGTMMLWKGRASDAKLALARRLKEFAKDKLEAAEASGQFKPIPRKGVTIGMHWLLPKPFGNDFRQEPWMQHATDSLVYVPQRTTKVTEVPPENVLKTGDWRDQIVPSPAGRDMVFMQ
jgi:hypothetical protein